MSNYNSIKATINANIKTNGNQEITGSVLNSVLNAMVNTLGAGYQYAGVASLTANPGAQDAKVFYIAATAGTYTNFGNIIVSDGEVAILKWDTGWSKETVGIASAADLALVAQRVTDIEGKDGSVVRFGLVANEYVSASDGAFLAYNGWSRTTFIPIGNYSTIDIQGSRSAYNYLYDANKNPVNSINLALVHTLDLSRYPSAKYIVISDSNANMANLVITASGYKEINLKTLGDKVSALEDSSGAFDILPQDGLAFVKHLNAESESGYITTPLRKPILLPKGMSLRIRVSGVTVSSGVIAAYFKDSDGAYYSANSSGADIARSFSFDEDKIIVEYGVNKSAASVIFSADMYFMAGYISKIEEIENRIAEITSELSSIRSDLVVKEEEIDTLRYETIGVNRRHDASELTSSRYYSLTDGSFQGESGSYNSGEYEISSDIIRMTASFPASNWSFGILLYDSDGNFIRSYHADTSIDIDLDGLGVAKAIVQNYSGWSDTVFAFMSKDHISELEEDVEYLKGEISAEYTTIVATRNASDYNSIREIVAGITDASPSHRYIVFVPVGRWFECDLQGKQYVYIVGEDREQTILYCDGTSNKLTPSDYSYGGTTGGVALSSLPQSQKHCVFAKQNVSMKNLTIEVNDAKYCVHLDSSGWGSAEFENCHFIAKANVNYPIGIGILGEQRVSISGCILERETPGLNGFFAHNWNNQSAPSSISFEDCYFKRCGFATIDELGSEQEDDWKILNCYSDMDGQISWMVDHDSNGDTYWVNPATGQKESDPTNVPYCIKLNCMGSNVGILVRQTYNGTSVVARPDCAKYLMSDNLSALIESSHPVGKAIKGFKTGTSIVEGDSYPLLGIIDSIVDGVSYMARRNVCVLTENIHGDSQSTGSLVYVGSDGYLTTTQTGNAVGVIYGDYAGIGKYIHLF